MHAERSPAARGADAGSLSGLRRLIETIEYCMLTTHVQGGLSSRPLQTLGIDDDATLWFFTARKSEKVQEIRSDARVCVAYADTGRRIFVALSGEAAIIDDRARAAALWRPAQRIFFPLGPDDAELTLLRVVPDAATVWDGNEPLLGMIRKFGKAVLGGEASDLGTVNEVALPGDAMSREGTGVYIGAAMPHG